jgi:hypothetical protein
VIFHNYLFDPPLHPYAQYPVQIYPMHEVHGTTPVVTENLICQIHLHINNPSLKTMLKKGKCIEHQNHCILKLNKAYGLQPDKKPN